MGRKVTLQQCALSTRHSEAQHSNCDRIIDLEDRRHVTASARKRCSEAQAGKRRAWVNSRSKPCKIVLRTSKKPLAA